MKRTRNQNENPTPDNSASPLPLRREVIRVISSPELQQVAGGDDPAGCGLPGTDKEKPR
jgi:hypothetical protein